ncbi:hypothetical protein GWI33_007869 [Rhynchophorus ferrugineus]|uniref:Alpha 1,4-glycosyltransferase domain-containing protein n=1 Tax=Rhynchophorus ferrugineus TaxID=354439 RepID=A0A834MCP6_RHYFE|nr:hypothetical protein GWI33_007869 [Rhynchophorus ferrugineus]
MNTLELYKQYYKFVNNNDEFVCYSINTNERLPEIGEAYVVKDTSIFFLETSCNSYINAQLTVSPRQACAVESAALMNPKRMVYLLFASPGLFYNSTQSDRLLQALISYPNIKLLYINMDKYADNTPVEKLWKSKEILKGEYPLSHTSDLLRYITLWKYGGIYMDLDTMTIKNLNSLPTNFAGVQDEYTVASGVLGFSSKGDGHQYINSCLYELADHYDGHSWAENGPKIITGLTNRLCESYLVKDYVGKTCKDFYIFSSSAFYPIYYTYFDSYFNPNHMDYVKNVTSNSYILHMWNKLSMDKKIYLYENVPYLYFAKRYCPRTVKNIDSYF